MSMLKLGNCSETQKKQNEGKIWSAMCNFFLVSHIKITNFRENYIFTGVKIGPMACLGIPL